MKCPRCGEECEQETVDVGVGEIPCGPLGCDNCHWIEGVPEDELEPWPREHPRKGE